MLILILRMRICVIFALTLILVITLNTAEVSLFNAVQDNTQSQTVAPELRAEVLLGGGSADNDDGDLSELLLLLCSRLSHPEADIFR